MDNLFLVIVGISEIISLYCIYKLWKGCDKFLKKVLWSFILVIPLLGPIFYGGMHNPPPPQSEDLKTPFTGETFWEDTHAREHLGHGENHDCD